MPAAVAEPIRILLVEDDPGDVLTTREALQAEEDVARSFRLHANAYVSKPVDFDQFVAIVRQVDDHFLSAARLPGRP